MSTGYAAKPLFLRPFILFFVFLYIVCGISITANASGSFRPSNTADLQKPYNLGKRIFHKKIACDSCPLPIEKLDKERAKEIIQQLNTRRDLIDLLQPREREAAIYYLKKRHKIS